MLWKTCLVVAVCMAPLEAQSAPPSLAIEHEIVLRGGSTSAVAWSGDGKWIACGGYTGEVLVVDAASGKLHHELLASSHWIGAMRFAPDRSALFVGGHALTRWDLRSGKETVRVTPGHPNAMALSRDGSLVAHTTPEGKVAIRAARDLRLEFELTVPDETACDALAFDAAGARLAVGKRSGRSYEFELASRRVITEHAPPTGRDQHAFVQVQSLAYLDDDRLVRLDWQGNLLGYSTEPQTLGHSGFGMSVDPGAALCLAWGHDQIHAFLRAGPRFTVVGGGPAAVHPSGTSWVRVRDSQLEFFRDASCVRTLPIAQRTTPGECVFVDGGRHLAIGGMRARLFDLANGALVALPCELSGTPIAYPGSEEMVLWTTKWDRRLHSSSGTLTFWSVAALRAGRAEPNRACPTGDVEMEWQEPVFSRDGQHFALGPTIRATEQPAESRWQLPERADSQWAQPLPGGESAWLVEEDRYRRTVQLCHADGPHDAQTELWGHVIGWSPDGTRLLTARDDSVAILDAATMQVVRSIAGSSSAAWFDDQRVLVQEHGGALSLVATADGAVLARLQQAGLSGRLTVAADGSRCAIAMSDRIVVVRISGD